MSDIKVIYFGVYGRVEFIRMLLTHAKVSFEDERLDGPAFGARKAAGEFPNGQLPVVVHNGKMLNESTAILRYLGKHFGYYPTDPHEAWYADSLVDYSNDFIGKTYPSIMNKNFNDDTKKAYTDIVNTYCAYFNKQLKSHGKAFIAGDKPTTADFHVTSYLCSFVNNKHSPMPEDWAAAAKAALAANPEFNAYAEKMFAEFKDYLDSRPPAPI